MNGDRGDRIARKLNVLRMERDSLINELDLVKEQDLDESDSHRKFCMELQSRITQVEREMLFLHFEFNSVKLA